MDILGSLRKDPKAFASEAESMAAALVEFPLAERLESPPAPPAPDAPDAPPAEPAASLWDNNEPGSYWRQVDGRWEPIEDHAFELLVAEAPSGSLVDRVTKRILPPQPSRTPDRCGTCLCTYFWEDLQGQLHCCECVTVFSRRILRQLWRVVSWWDHMGGQAVERLAWDHWTPGKWNPFETIEQQEEERMEKDHPKDF